MLRFSVLFLMAFFLTSHLTASEKSKKVVEFVGLPEKTVNTLVLDGKNLYAGTEGDGLYKLDLATPDVGWVLLGATNIKIQSMVTYEELEFGKGMILGAQPNFQVGDSTLIYFFSNELQTTIAIDDGMDARSISKIQTVAQVEAATKATLLAGGQGQIYRKVDSHWKKVLDIGGGQVNVIYPANSNQIVWAGGETGFLNSFLAKSLDGGNTWQISYPDLNGDNAINSLVSLEELINVLYAGTEGSIIKSYDGGTTWESTSLKETPNNFVALIVDPLNQEHIFSGGIPANNAFALFESFDAGKLWYSISAPVPLNGVKALVFDTEPQSLYIATKGTGVWRLTGITTEVGCGDCDATPQDFVLLQNYPNPFGTETTINYYSKKIVDAQFVIYNLLGEKVKTIDLQTNSTGLQKITWDGKDEHGNLVPNGVYFYRVRIDNSIQIKKAVLIR